MQNPAITRAACALPEHRIGREAVRAHAPALFEGTRHADLLARATHIDERAIALPLDELCTLGSIEQRNGVYARLAPALALRAASEVTGDPREIGCVVTSSCTGYSVPGWNVQIAEQLCLRDDVARLPITEAGCAGGVVAIACAADFLRARRRGAALAVACELCSLAFHAGGSAANYIASLIFADGASAVRVEMGGRRGFAIVDQLSVLLPHSRHLLGFDLTDAGFYPVIGDELTDVLAAALPSAAGRLLARNGIAARDVTAWLLHPGGARILAHAGAALGIDAARARWSWESMRQCGNMSSASIFDVIRRALDEPPPPGWHVAAAFGPGVSIELLLLRSAA